MSGSKSNIGLCAHCGLVLPHGYASCSAMFDAVVVRDYSDAAFGEAHLFAVDAYALQHPEAHGPKANAFHLVRLCWLFEHGGDPSIRQIHHHHPHGPPNAVREQRYNAFPVLEPPARRGELTIASVLGAKTPGEHTARVRAWAQSVWEAWSSHHSWAREQATEFFK
jgi:hypothetical protein